MSGKISKKRKNTITLVKKLEILRRFDAGEKAADIARILNIPVTSIRSIRNRDAEKIREVAKNANSLMAQQIVKSKSPLIVLMESLLSTWVEQQNQRKVPLSRMLIQEKAISIFEELKSRPEHVHNNEIFHVSRGWFQKYKSRAKLHNLALKGEASSGNTVAAEDFKNVFKNIIANGEYSAKQIFKVDETGLYWKRLPKRTYVSQQEKHASGFKANKERLTLLLGANAAGDHRLKPLLIHTSQNPRAMKNKQRHLLPVHWRWNRKGWMTATLFREWVRDIAVPELKDYCLKENLDFKILILLDNAPSHPPDLDDICENIKFVFLPPNTTALIQPMDQGVISNFKAYYLRRTFIQLFPTLNDELSIKTIWKQFNILKAVENIGASWKEVKPGCLKGVWRKLWPESTEDAVGIDNVEETINDLVHFAQHIHFEGMEVNDIQEMLNQDEEDITPDELLQNFTAATDNVLEHTEEVREITNQKLAQAFSLIDKAMDIFIDHDNDENRSKNVMNAVAKGIQCYKDLYTMRKKNARQQTLDDFLKTKT